MPVGPLLGNGKLAEMIAGDNKWSRFYIKTTDFWTGAHLNAIPLPIMWYGIYTQNEEYLVKIAYTYSKGIADFLDAYHVSSEAECQQ